MDLNSSIFVWIGAIASAIGLLTTAVTLVWEHKRLMLQKQAEIRQRQAEAEKQVPTPETKSKSSIHIKTSTYQGV